MRASPALAALAFAALLSVTARRANAHDWYPVECCHDNDCAQIADESVQETPNGYVVTIAPGGHPMWQASKQRPLTIAVPYAKARRSPDGHFHLCMSSSGYLFCFFAALGGY